LEAKDKIFRAISRLDQWLEEHDYKGYDPFDGLSSKVLRPFTFNNSLLRIALQQGIRRFPINLRPAVGIKKSHSSKGMGFLVRGYLRLHKATGEKKWEKKARSCLEWLICNQSKGYSGACWGNHFDYQSRVFYLPKGVPTVVWVALIGHAFLDAYERLKDNAYLDIAISSCEHITNDLDRLNDEGSVCISYIPIENKQVHNANTLGASLLARTYSITGRASYRDLATAAIRYTVKYQRDDRSWYYGEASDLHWVDNFHTAYVLDSIKHVIAGTGDTRYRNQMKMVMVTGKEPSF